MEKDQKTLQFYNFSNEKFKFIIRWITGNLKSLFPLKDKDLYPAYKIYKRICSWESTPMSVQQNGM